MKLHKGFHSERKARVVLMSLAALVSLSKLCLRNAVKALVLAMSLAVLGSGPTAAQTNNANPITQTGGGGNVPDVVTIFDNGMSAVNTTFAKIDTTLALLQNAIKLLSFVPGIGQLAQMLTPIINTYLDIKTTFMPIMDAANRGRQFVVDALNAKQTLNRIFSSNNINDSVNDINTLVSQMGGLTNLPVNLRKVDPKNMRQSIQNILGAADQQIAAANRAAEKARQNGNFSEYRHQLRIAAELTGNRQRLRQIGETSAAQQDMANLVTRTSTIAKATAEKSIGTASTLQTIQSEVGGIKTLGTLAIDQLNAQTAGFDTLSQQLGVISQQLTISNEQAGALLEHFEAQERAKNAKVKLALEADADRREQEYRSMVSKTGTLSDGIAQTFAPDPNKVSDVAGLMDGVVR